MLALGILELSEVQTCCLDANCNVRVECRLVFFVSQNISLKVILLNALNVIFDTCLELVIQ